MARLFTTGEKDLVRTLRDLFYRRGQRRHLDHVVRPLLRRCHGLPFAPLFPLLDVQENLTKKFSEGRFQRGFDRLCRQGDLLRDFDREQSDVGRQVLIELGTTTAYEDRTSARLRPSVFGRAGVLRAHRKIN